MAFGLVIGFIEHLQNVTTDNYNNSLIELHTPKITVTTAHLKSSQFAMSSPVTVTDLNRVICFHAHILSHSSLVAPAVNSQLTVLLITSWH
jgi:hypothetical protein